MNELLEKATEKISTRAGSKPALGHTVKLAMTDIGIIYLDGTGDKNVVTNEDKDAELTITTTWAVMHAIEQGETDAFTQYMLGKLSIDGNQSIAVAFGSLIEQ